MFVQIPQSISTADIDAFLMENGFRPTRRARDFSDIDDRLPVVLLAKFAVSRGYYLARTELGSLMFKPRDEITLARQVENELNQTDLLTQDEVDCLLQQPDHDGFGESKADGETENQRKKSLMTRNIVDGMPQNFGEGEIQ